MPGIPAQAGLGIDAWGLWGYVVILVFTLITLWLAIRAALYSSGFPPKPRRGFATGISALVACAVAVIVVVVLTIRFRHVGYLVFALIPLLPGLWAAFSMTKCSRKL